MSRALNWASFITGICGAWILIALVNDGPWWKYGLAFIGYFLAHISGGLSERAKALDKAFQPAILGASE